MCCDDEGSISMAVAVTKNPVSARPGAAGMEITKPVNLPPGLDVSDGYGAAFAGQGWQKFANNSDSAIMAFTTLASHARVAQGPTSYRQEADNMVLEIYVW